jgi:pimeloyl-ACP methyl ester carboxylesterase
MRCSRSGPVWRPGPGGPSVCSVRRVDAAFTPSHRGGSGPPLVCVHGFTDTWRTWELVLPELERHHDVLAVTLAGHAGGPPISDEPGDGDLADAVEQAMDEAGFETAHLVGNSLGGYVALKLASRGRARTVVALAPAGGWARGDESFRDTLEYFADMGERLKAAAPHAEAIVSSPEGRRLATAYTTVNFEHIPPALLAHQIRGAASCGGLRPLIGLARRDGWNIDAAQIVCPVRIVWGSEDRILPWPAAAARYRHDWLPNADWVQLDGAGHCPQLDVPLETAQLILGFTS